jgi:hypothetical protein
MTTMRGGVAWIAAVVFVAGTGGAQAATLVLDAPASCVDPATLAQDVADLVGRPLNEIPDLDFLLTIRPMAGAQWHSTLDAIERRPGLPEVRHRRELEGRSCADLAEAAAVAMSVSIRAVSEAATPARGRPAMREPEPTKAPPAVLLRAAPPPAARAPWRGFALATLATDAGELPGGGLGVGLGVGIGRGVARLNVLGGWFPSRDSVRSNGTGGSFQLAFGGAEACFAPSRGNWTALGCAGAELGIQHGTGVGVANSIPLTAFWRAARASLGFVLRSSDRLGLVVTATAVAPLARPEFVLDQTSAVYRAAPIAGRLAVGLQMSFF